MKKKKDYCTWFPEKWVKWKSLLKWEVVDISDCCKKHDNTCSTSQFAKCLRSKKIVGSSIITLGGMVGCIVKFPKRMIKRV